MPLKPKYQWTKEFERGPTPIHVFDFNLTPLLVIELGQNFNDSQGNGDQIQINWGAGTVEVGEGADFDGGNDPSVAAVEIANALKTKFATETDEGVRVFFDTKRFGQGRIFIVGGVNDRDGTTITTDWTGSEDQIRIRAPVGPNFSFCSGQKPIQWTPQNTRDVDHESGLPSPSLSRTSTLSINNPGTPTSQNLYGVADVEFPETGAAGVIWEQGGTGIGLYLGVTNGELVFRWGAGGTPGSSSAIARTTVDAAQFAGARWLIHFEVNISANTAKLWWQNTIGAGNPLGKTYAAPIGQGAGSMTSWAGSDSGAFTTSSGSMVLGEDTNDWTGTGWSLRLYYNRTAPNSLSNIKLGWAYPTFEIAGENGDSLDALNRESSIGDMSIHSPSDAASQLLEYFPLRNAEVVVSLGSRGMGESAFLRRKTLVIEDAKREGSGITKFELVNSFKLLEDLEIDSVVCANVHPLELIRELVTAFRGTDLYDSESMDETNAGDNLSHFCISLRKDYRSEDLINYLKREGLDWAVDNAAFNYIDEAYKLIDVVNEVAFILGGTIAPNEFGQISFKPWVANQTAQDTWTVGQGKDGYDCQPIETIDPTGQIINDVTVSQALGFRRENTDIREQLRSFAPVNQGIQRPKLAVDQKDIKVPEGYPYQQADARSVKFLGKFEDKFSLKLVHGIATFPLVQSFNNFNPRGSTALTGTQTVILVGDAAYQGFCGSRVRGVSRTINTVTVTGTFSFQNSLHNLASTRLATFIVEQRRNFGNDYYANEITCDNFVPVFNFDASGLPGEVRGNYVTSGNPYISQPWAGSRDDEIADVLFPNNPITAIGVYEIDTRNGPKSTSSSPPSNTYTRSFGQGYEQTFGWAEIGRNYTRIVDVTITKTVGRRILDRFAYGAPQIRVRTRMSKIIYSVGDFVTFSGDDNFSGMHIGRADDVVWEITKATPLWDDGMMEFELTFARYESAIDYAPNPAFEIQVDDPDVRPRRQSQYPPSTPMTIPFTYQTQGDGDTVGDILLNALATDIFWAGQTGLVLFTARATTTRPVTEANANGRFEVSGVAEWNGSTFGSLTQTYDVRLNDALNHELRVATNSDDLGIEFEQGGGVSEPVTCIGTIELLLWAN